MIPLLSDGSGQEMEQATRSKITGVKAEGRVPGRTANPLLIWNDLSSPVMAVAGWTEFSG